MGTNWMGGPSSDYTTGTMEGGYVFVYIYYKCIHIYIYIKFNMYINLNII